MADKKGLSFKQSEIIHLLTLIEKRKQDGWYYGKKEKYEKRESVIHNKLKTAANTMPNKSGKEGGE
jgi:hypothetical protein